MKNPHLAERLAVCSWSLQPVDPQDLIAKIKATEISQIQLALDPLRESPEVWDCLPGALKDSSIKIVSGMFGCVGEDYSTLDSIRRTGGIAPDSTWEQNWKNIQATAVLAQKLNLNLVTFHAGFLPHDTTDQDFAKMINRLGQVSDAFQRANILVGLETGQETAASLAAVLTRLNRQNVCVNFDPANMILYDKGDPVEAVHVLGKWIKQVHLKDATRTTVPGQWGAEVPVGTGEVPWTGFFAALNRLNFSGSLVIEREAGTQRVQDIRRAKRFAEANAA